MADEKQELKLPTPEQMKAIEHLANVQAIRVNSFEPYNEAEFMEAVDTTREDVEIEFTATKRFMYVINSISARNKTNARTNTEIALIRGGQVMELTSSVQTSNLYSVDWSGNLIAIPGDKIRATFVGCTANDDLYLSVNGYTLEM